MQEAQKLDKLEIHFVAKGSFERLYPWAGSITPQEQETLKTFSRGQGLCIPNDDPLMLAAFVADDHHVTVEKDIMPAIMALKKLMLDAEFHKHDFVCDDIQIKFSGFVPNESIKEATLMLMHNFVGMGYKYHI